MNKKTLAVKAFDTMYKRRRVAFDSLEVEEEDNEDVEIDPSNYFSAGTGFPPESKEKEVYAEMESIAEENDGDFGMIKDKPVTDRFFDAMQLRLDKRKSVIDRLFKDAQVHAPAGGVTVKGKEFKGGEFIPSAGGYAEAFKKQQAEEKPKEEAPKEEAPAEKKEEPKKEEKKKPKTTLGKAPKIKKEYTPEEQAAREEKAKLKAERSAHFKSLTVGVKGEELTKELAGCKQRREKAKVFWGKLGVDLDDGRKIEEGGYSPDTAVKTAMENEDFKKLPLQERISVVSEMQRKNLKNSYVDKVSVNQNEKQDSALIYGADTVRGCMNNCISCYACNLAGGITQVKFDSPVACDIAGKASHSKEEIEKDKANLEKQIPELEKTPDAVRKVKPTVENPSGEINILKEAKDKITHWTKQLDEMGRVGVDKTFLRIGVVGDPASNWEHTNEVMKKKLNGKGFENVVYVSKLQRIDGFDPSVIKNMHVSVDPFNKEHMDKTMANVLALKKRDPDLNIVLRIRSFDSKNPELMGNLKQAVQFANDNDLPVLETKMRYTKTVATLLEMNTASYHETDGVNIKANHNFLGTGGYDAKEKKAFKNEGNALKANKYYECDKLLEGCQSCGNCVKTILLNKAFKKEA